MTIIKTEVTTEMRHKTNENLIIFLYFIGFCIVFIIILLLDKRNYAQLGVFSAELLNQRTKQKLCIFLGI